MGFLRQVAKFSWYPGSGIGRQDTAGSYRSSFVAEASLIQTFLTQRRIVW